MKQPEIEGLPGFTELFERRLREAPIGPRSHHSRLPHFGVVGTTTVLIGATPAPAG